MSKNTEYSRAWRRKLQAKAQLFDELAGFHTSVDVWGPDPEATRAREYVKAHPLRPLACGGVAHIRKDPDGSYEVFDREATGDCPDLILALVAAALREITSSPVVAACPKGSQYMQQAADITRRMREAGIWTGPR